MNNPQTLLSCSPIPQYCRNVALGPVHDPNQMAVLMKVQHICEPVNHIVAILRLLEMTKNSFSMG